MIKYEEPELEIIKFSEQDIIVASPEYEDDDGENMPAGSPDNTQ